MFFDANERGKFFYDIDLTLNQRGTGYALQRDARDTGPRGLNFSDDRNISFFGDRAYAAHPIVIQIVKIRFASGSVDHQAEIVRFDLIQNLRDLSQRKFPRLPPENTVRVDFRHFSFKSVDKIGQSFVQRNTCAVGTTAKLAA